MSDTSQPTQCECHECTQARWNSSIGGQIARVMHRVETFAMDGLQFENNRLKKDRDALLEACKFAYNHVEELRESWQRGDIHEIGIWGVLRSDRNAEVSARLSHAIAAAER